MNDPWNRALNEVLLNADTHQDLIAEKCFKVKVDWNEANRVVQLLVRGETVDTTFSVLQYIVWTHESALVVMAARELLRAKTMQELSVAVDRERWRAEDEAYVPPKRYEYVDSGFGVFVDAR